MWVGPDYRVEGCGQLPQPLAVLAASGHNISCTQRRTLGMYLSLGFSLNIKYTVSLLPS